jgi:type IV pilus assembly protein PilB
MYAANGGWRPIGQVLVEGGHITQEDLHLALEEQKRTGRRLGETLIETGRISWLGLAQAIAEQANGLGPAPQARPPATAPPPAPSNEPQSLAKLETVEALLKERQRAFLELVSTAETLRRKVAKLETELLQRNAEIVRLKSGVGTVYR